MTQPAASARDTARWVRAILVIFLTMGFGFGTWLSRLPTLRDELGASLVQMSVYGLSLAAGSLIGLFLAGPLVERQSPRKIMAVAIALQLVLLPAAILLLTTGALAGGAATLLLYGFCFSITDIAMNVSGAAAERVLGKPRMPLLHAGYSIGVMLATGLGAAAEALRVSLPWHYLIAVALIGAAAFWVLRWVPRDEAALLSGEDQPLPLATGPLPLITSKVAAGPTRYSPWRDRRVLLIGLITLSAGLIEGAPADWLPLALVDGRGVSNEFGAVMLGLFFGAVVAARLAGSWLLTRFGRVAVLRASLACAAVGVLIVVLVPGLTGVILGTVLWGLGTGVCWPITISAAADRPETAARDVAAVSAVGYTSMLLGPMAFGFLGEQIGLLQAFWVLPVFALIALLLSGVTRPR